MVEVKGDRGGGKVYRDLRADILRLNLKPGSVIDEAKVGERYSVSRTPVREAVILLISEGLVVRDGRVALVAPLNFDDLPKIYDALVMSSRIVQRLAATNRTDADLARIRKAMTLFERACATGNGIERGDTNTEFHMAIAEAGRNTYFTSFYERMLLTASRLSHACFADRHAPGSDPEARHALETHLKTTMQQHLAIFDALLRQDAERADRLAVEHQQLSFSRLKAAIFKTSMQGAEDLNLELEQRDTAIFPS
ncbi:MAG: GntR family transcriptional regulator [Rhodobacteraceae bacterium]|uniref:GntR family transcriptional regulator n=1 Tax=Salipiger thiooxidans TaxID=282683 RepID=UPI001A8D7EFA|nr:GntR family transcriptional regulator [Salipiger thiooxidans]MBN8190154.1 GntR family transcriptional regulator [Salipiger thiooxidans]MBR9841354.1 GntR family transcriptional regulator [Paracoccaceae bacterium]